MFLNNLLCLLTSLSESWPLVYTEIIQVSTQSMTVIGSVTCYCVFPSSISKHEKMHRSKKKRFNSGLFLISRWLLVYKPWLHPCSLCGSEPRHFLSHHSGSWLIPSRWISELTSSVRRCFYRIQICSQSIRHGHTGPPCDPLGEMHLSHTGAGKSMFSQNSLFLALMTRPQVAHSVI